MRYTFMHAQRPNRPLRLAQERRQHEEEDESPGIAIVLPNPDESHAGQCRHSVCIGTRHEPPETTARETERRKGDTPPLLLPSPAARQLPPARRCTRPHHRAAICRLLCLTLLPKPLGIAIPRVKRSLACESGLRHLVKSPPFLSSSTSLPSLEDTSGSRCPIPAASSQCTSRTGAPTRSSNPSILRQQRRGCGGRQSRALTWEGTWTSRSDCKGMPSSRGREKQKETRPSCPLVRTLWPTMIPRVRRLFPSVSLASFELTQASCRPSLGLVQREEMGEFTPSPLLATLFTLVARLVVDHQCDALHVGPHSHLLLDRLRTYRLYSRSDCKS